MSSTRWRAAFSSAATSDVSVLVVDASATMRRIVVQSLHRIGYDRTREAASAAEALDALDADSEALVTAWTLPDMSGAALTRAVRSLPSRADLPIFVVLTRTTRQDAPAALAAGATECLVKPFTPQGLKEKMEVFLPRIAA